MALELKNTSENANEQYPIVLFDGFCNLCNGTVNFILKRDKQKQFRFAALQSEAGQILLKNYSVPSGTDSVVLIYKGEILTESDAILSIASLLPVPWKWGKVFTILPAGFRNRIYRWIARNRYRCFGKRKECRLPSPEERKYFLKNGKSVNSKK